MTTSTDMEAEPKPPQSCDSEGQSHPLGDSGSVSGASLCSLTFCENNPHEMRDLDGEQRQTIFFNYKIEID